MYKLKKIVGTNNASAQFIRIISNYKILFITLIIVIDCRRGGQPNHS